MRTNRTHDARIRTLEVEVKGIKVEIADQGTLLRAMAAHMGVDTPAKPAKVTSKPAARKAPAKKAPAKKAPAKKAPVAKVTKGVQTRETLSRKDWNRTLTAKAKLAGGDTYKRVLAAWDDVQALRDSNFTPDEALARF